MKNATINQSNKKQIGLEKPSSGAGSVSEEIFVNLNSSISKGISLIEKKSSNKRQAR